ncbi:MAG TPA: winged helix-turn-helix domain-containing protein [Methanomassiliicoccales archaeon]|nr:winged helix-turn-helix domain-containing protein [Methanomassiliicoccales archaeon]
MSDEDQNAKSMTLVLRRLDEIESSLRQMQVRRRPIDSTSGRARSDLLEVMVSQNMEDVGDGLSRNMVKRCDMKEPCRATFTAFLQKNASLLEQDTVREETIITNQGELDRLRETAPYDKCEKCFDEVARLFGKQVRLMRSMRIYSTSSDTREHISEIPEELLVKQVLEPMSNRQRMQIIKALSQDARTFSSLAEITGLRGGNLLFHIQKLVDTGLIIQRHDRGDYMITEKGFRVLKGLSDVYQTLKP